MNVISWYDPHYTSNFSQQKLMLEQIVSRSATELA